MSKYQNHSLSNNVKRIVAISIILLAAVDASAIPFFSQRPRAAQASIQAEGPDQPSGVMTAYTEDVHSGVGDFVYLARNFSGSAAGNGRNPSGLIGGLEEPIGVVTPAPEPGSVALLALGGLLLWRWRDR